MMRAFEPVKDAGGGSKWPTESSGLWMLQFSSQLNKQYLIWKLTFSTKILGLNNSKILHEVFLNPDHLIQYLW